MDEPPSNNPVFELFSFPESIFPVLIISAGLLLFSVFISSAEAAFFSLNSSDLENFKRVRGSREKAILSLLNEPRLLWNTFSTLNILVRCALVTLCILASFSSSYGWSLKAVMAIAILSFIFLGGIIPKLLGKKFNIAIAVATARLWRVFMLLAKPVTIPMARLANSWRSTKGEKKAPVDGLSQALALAAELEGVSEGEKEILKGIANFGTLTVRQVMRTRSEISAIAVKSNFVELMEYVNKSGFSRIPVYENTIDSIIGVLYIKDLLPFLEDQDGFEWQSLLRPGFFVPENKKIDLLLKEFQEKRVHMAIVIGEYGGTMGLVTLEDLIEEIIGEINDEFDEVEHHFKKIDSNTYVFDGNTSLNDFCKALDIDHKIFQKVKGTSESLAGLVLALNRKFPKAGDQVSHEQFHFSVESLDRKGIKRVKVMVHEQAQ